MWARIRRLRLWRSLITDFADLEIRRFCLCNFWKICFWGLHRWNWGQFFIWFCRSMRLLSISCWHIWCWLVFHYRVTSAAMDLVSFWGCCKYSATLYLCFRHCHWRRLPRLFFGWSSTLNFIWDDGITNLSHSFSWGIRHLFDQTTSGKLMLTAILKLIGNYKERQKEMVEGWARTKDTSSAECDASLLMCRHLIRNWQVS